MEKMLEQMTKIGKEIDCRLDEIVAKGRILQNDATAIKKEYDSGDLKLTYTATYDRAREITREVYYGMNKRVYLSINNQIQEFHREGNWLGSFDGLYEDIEGWGKKVDDEDDNYEYHDGWDFTRANNPLGNWRK